MRGFVIHLGIFMVVVGLLAAINLYRRPDHIWFIWVLGGWGIGTAAHDLALLLPRSKPGAGHIQDCGWSLVEGAGTLIGTHSMRKAAILLQDWAKRYHPDDGTRTCGRERRDC